MVNNNTHKTFKHYNKIKKTALIISFVCFAGYFHNARSATPDMPQESYARAANSSDAVFYEAIKVKKIWSLLKKISHFIASKNDFSESKLMNLTQSESFFNLIINHQNPENFHKKKPHELNAFKDNKQYYASIKFSKNDIFTQAIDDFVEIIYEIATPPTYGIKEKNAIIKEIKSRLIHQANKDINNDLDNIFYTFFANDLLAFIYYSRILGEGKDFLGDHYSNKAKEIASHIESKHLLVFSSDYKDLMSLEQHLKELQTYQKENILYAYAKTNEILRKLNNNFFIKYHSIVKSTFYALIELSQKHSKTEKNLSDQRKTLLTHQKNEFINHIVNFIDPGDFYNLFIKYNKIISVKNFYKEQKIMYFLSDLYHKLFFDAKMLDTKPINLMEIFKHKIHKIFTYDVMKNYFSNKDGIEIISYITQRYHEKIPLLTQDDILDLYQHIADLYPDNIFYQTNTGTMLFNCHNYTLATRYYEKGANLSPDPADYWYNINFLVKKELKQEYKIEQKHELKEEKENALLNFTEKAIALNSQRGQYHYMLGIKLFRLKHYEKALVAFKNAIDLGYGMPFVFDALKKLLLLLMKKIDSRYMTIDHNINLENADDNSIQLSYQIGIILFDLEKFRSARLYLEAAAIADKEGRYPKLHYLTGRLFDLESNPHKAFKYYTKAYILEPHNPQFKEKFTIFNNLKLEEEIGLIHQKMI